MRRCASLSERRAAAGKEGGGAPSASSKSHYGGGTSKMYSERVTEETLCGGFGGHRVEKARQRGRTG